MQMTQQELNEIVRLHELWVNRDPAGQRADLSGANLSGADLSGANLSGAYLSDANLSGADLSGAYLYHADLSGVNLSNVNLSGANLHRANLSGVNLSGANLSNAYLYRANLHRANLSGANLSGANLSSADLSGANLYRALKTAMVQWTNHGESGRMLTAILLPHIPATETHQEQNVRVEYRCGCFVGSEAELRQYIADGDARYHASRTLAVDFCAARMAEMLVDKEATHD